MAIQFPPRNLEYDSSKLNYKPDLMMGLIDSDGNYHSRIRERSPGSVTYECSVRVTQTIANRDVIDSMIHTLGFGNISYTNINKKKNKIPKNISHQKEIDDDLSNNITSVQTSVGRKPTVCGVWDLNTVSGENFLK
jgi:hypothetical protein